MKKTLVILVAIVLLGIGAKTVYTEYQEYKKTIVEMEMQENILDGATAQPATIKVDYSKQITNGSPLIFGGSHSPPITHKDAWDKLAAVGVTSIRNDLFVEFTLPRNITIADYSSNKNNVKNTDNWDQKTINSLQNTFALAKKSGMKVIGIMGYAPRWLTYTNTAFGVPKDWDVFEDIVKKEYKLYRDKLDYIEIWNEPDHRIFLVTEKSGLSKEEAYKKIYDHSVKAIKEVDAEINDGRHVPIGAPAESNAKLSTILTSLVNDPSTPRKPDFISFHGYDENLLNSSLEKYRTIDTQYLGGNTPIFITEWNNDVKGRDNTSAKIGDLAIAYTGNTLITYLRQGITGANYFGLLPINSADRDTDEKTMGFYRWKNEQAELLPQSKTWKLLSRTLSFGKGTSKIVETNSDENVNAVGAVNISGEHVAAVANTSDTPQLLELQLNKMPLQGRAVVYVYVASKDHDSSKPIRNEIAEIKDNTLKTRFYIPERSVAGVIVKPFTNKWFDLFDAITR